MELEVFLKLLLAVFLGFIVGLEREIKKKGAGIQTYSLVCLGACLFSTVAFSLGRANLVEPSYVLMAIALGMGFIGGGAIFKSENRVLGLTTAAGLWTMAAVGLAIGAGLYPLAIFTVFLVLLILAGFGYLEEKIF